jgi:phosphoglucomutase
VSSRIIDKVVQKLGRCLSEPWTTDKDAPVMDLLAGEITARTRGKDPREHYRQLIAEFEKSDYTRVDSPATPEQKARLQAYRRMRSLSRTWPGSRS